MVSLIWTTVRLRFIVGEFRPQHFVCFWACFYSDRQVDSSGDILTLSHEWAVSRRTPKQLNSSSWMVEMCKQVEKIIIISVCDSLVWIINFKFLVSTFYQVLNQHLVFKFPFQAHLGCLKLQLLNKHLTSHFHWITSYHSARPDTSENLNVCGFFRMEKQVPQKYVKSLSMIISCSVFSLHVRDIYVVWSFRLGRWLCVNVPSCGKEVKFLETVKIVNFLDFSARRFSRIHHSAYTFHISHSSWLHHDNQSHLAHTRCIGVESSISYVQKWSEEVIKIIVHSPQSFVWSLPLLNS